MSSGIVLKLIQDDFLTLEQLLVVAVVNILTAHELFQLSMEIVSAQTFHVVGLTSPHPEQIG